jgi:quercetin dioxygenase-like cupin family protein
MQPVMISVNGRTTKFELREHPGEQFIFMLEGEINYICGKRTFTLSAGDCLYFNARMSHGPKPERNQKARYLAVFTNENQRHRKH